MALGGAILLWLLAAKVVLGQALANRPLVLLGMLLLVVGVQFLSLGILGELIVRFYHEAAPQRAYLIRRLDATDNGMLAPIVVRDVHDQAGTGFTWPNGGATSLATRTVADGSAKQA